MIRELRRTQLNDLDTSDINRIFRAAEQGGVTAAARKILERTYDRYASTWSSARRQDWQSKLVSAKAPTDVSAPLSGPEPEDLSSRTKTVWMPGLGDSVQDAYIVDMTKLAVDLGFQLILDRPAWSSIAGIAVGLADATGLSVSELDKIVDVVPENVYASVWGEDNKIMTNGDDISTPVKVLVPPDVSETTLAKAENFTADEGYHPYEYGFQGAVTMRAEDDAAINTAHSLGRTAVRTKTYIEGGNLLPGTTSDGKPYAMVGRDSVVVSAFHLDAKNFFSNNKVQTRIQEMKAEGRMSISDIERTANKLLHAEQANSWHAPHAVNDDLRRQAQRFMATLELTEIQMAKDLGLSPKRFVVISQPDFHIDMHIRPLRPGEVLVNHPKACIEAIDDALTSPENKWWERRELKAMRKAAMTDLAEKGHVYDEIISQIEAAGLIALPAPGVFESGSRKANFMNAVPGTASSGETFFLTNASTLTSLEGAFARFLKREGDVERIEFLGGAGGGYFALSASEESLEMAGGLDCREVDHAGSRPPKNDLSSAVAAAGIA